MKAKNISKNLFTCESIWSVLAFINIKIKNPSYIFKYSTMYYTRHGLWDNELQHFFTFGNNTFSGFIQINH